MVLFYSESLRWNASAGKRGPFWDRKPEMEGWAQCPLSLLLSWYCLQIYSCSCTTQRNSIREDKAKQTKMVTMDIGKMVPCCWTPLQVSSCRKKTGSSSPSQPSGPLSHQAPTEPKLWPWWTYSEVYVLVGVWYMRVAEPRRRESLGHAGKGQSCWATVHGGQRKGWLDKPGNRDLPGHPDTLGALQLVTGAPEGFKNGVGMGLGCDQIGISKDGTGDGWASWVGRLFGGREISGNGLTLHPCKIWWWPDLTQEGQVLKQFIAQIMGYCWGLGVLALRVVSCGTGWSRQSRCSSSCGFSAVWAVTPGGVRMWSPQFPF